MALKFKLRLLRLSAKLVLTIFHVCVNKLVDDDDDDDDAHWYALVTESPPGCDETCEVTVLLPQGQLMVSCLAVHFREEFGASGDG